MTLTEYIAPRGTAAQLAKAIGVPPQLISQWSRGVRRVPAERCPDIEKATAGAVRCEDLRSDIEWSVVRHSDCIGHPEAAA